MIIACASHLLGAVTVLVAVVGLAVFFVSLVRRPVRQDEPPADYLVRELARRTGRDENVVRETLRSVGALPEEGMETERRWTP